MDEQMKYNAGFFQQRYFYETGPSVGVCWLFLGDRIQS